MAFVTATGLLGKTVPTCTLDTGIHLARRSGSAMESTHNEITFTTVLANSMGLKRSSNLPLL